MKKKYFFAILPFILAIGLFLLISQTKTPIVLVKKIELKDEVVTKSVSSSGEVTAVNKANLAFQTGGTVTKIFYSKGDFMKKGTLIAQAYDRALTESAQYYKDARDITLRNRDLFLEQYQSHDDAGGEEEYQIKLRTYDELVSQADANYKSSLATLRNVFIYAPFDGTIIDLPIKEGEVATSAAAVVNLADLDNLEFEIGLDQEDIGFIKVGQYVEILLDSYDGHKFTAVVTEVPLFANGSETFTVKIKLNADNDYTILLGMKGDAYITIESTKEAVSSLEFDQVFSDEDDKKYIWLVDSRGKISKKYIEVGMEGDIYTQVVTKIDQGMIIVVPESDDVKIEEGYIAKYL
ncbi:MAG: hypothetical protein ACD_22C00135G0008 [uncultured bacterium]|nr:MAG: hypothetical protein ACD_22C00135G0008 [uncultured bacterium]